MRPFNLYLGPFLMNKDHLFLFEFLFKLHVLNIVYHSQMPNS
jgi:hypothetical protein